MLNYLLDNDIKGKPLEVILNNGKEIEGILEEIRKDSIIIKTLFHTYIIQHNTISTVKIAQSSISLNLKSESFAFTESEINSSRNESKEEVPQKEELLVTTIVDDNETSSKKSESNDIDIVPPQGDHVVVDYTEANELYELVPWREVGIPEEKIFKGREKIIRNLINHYSSVNRNKTYVLYGLTRTGKSTIVKYLGDRLKTVSFTSQSKKYTFLPFVWRLNEACAQTNAADLWDFLLKTSTIDQLFKYVYTDKLHKEEIIPSDIITRAGKREKFAFKDFRSIIVHLKKFNIFPVFLIDEFTYYKDLHNSKKLDPSFLSTIREFSISNLASFLFAGTYDLKELIKDPAYGITGQFANTIEMQIGPIDDESAIELINAWQDRLKFSNDAIDYINLLSNKLPFFIQIICKNCAFYAIETNKWDLKYEDVESVIRIMLSEVKRNDKSLIDNLSPGLFNSNQILSNDPKEIQVLIGTICHLSSDIKIGAKRVEIIQKWGSHRIPGFQYKITENLDKLKDRGVILDTDGHGDSFRIGVDLFRRWWINEHPNLDHELNYLLKD